MLNLDDKPETIHLYVVREEEKRPHTAFPLFCAFLCLVGIVTVTWYSALHPYYEHARLTVPAQLLPLKVFEAEAQIIPTGIKTHPATDAEGILTLTNGSVLSETLPPSVVFSASSGVEVQTTESVFIPAGSASGYGVARVGARALQAGSNGNIQTLAVNAVYGTALYVRNLSPFTGGQDSYSVIFATAHDKQLALTAARSLLVAQMHDGYHYPCQERYVAGIAKVSLTWGCQFATYQVPAYLHVQAARLVGYHFLIDVTFVPRPHQIWVK